MSGDLIDISGDGGCCKKILREGTGTETPQKGNKVHVHYVGRLTDGTEFDSSRKRNEPFVFELGTGQVIKGWDTGVATMKKGELAELTCKPEYAYGKAGSPPSIPKNATLIFEVELLSWQDGEDISGDGGVVKRVISEGSGWKKPKANELVQVRVKGLRSKDGNVSDESTPVWFSIGDYSVYPQALHKAALNLKKGEKARITATPQYTFGEEQDSSFEVELVSWIETQDVSQDGGIIKRTLKEGDGYKTPKDGSIVKVKVAPLVDFNSAGVVDFLAKYPIEPRENVEEFEFELGSANGKVPEALEQVIETMKARERALVELSGKYAQPQSNATAFDLVLESFSAVKESWEMTPEEKIAHAAVCKEKGSELFRAGKYSAAEKKYNKGLKLVESDNTFSDAQKKSNVALVTAFYSNLAATYLKLQNPVEVVKYTKKVLETDPNNVKALFRRAQANNQLGEYEAAKADLVAASAFEPEDKAIKVELASVNQKIQQQRAKEKKLYGGLFEKLSKLEQKEKEQQNVKEDQKENKEKEEKEEKEEKGEQPVPMETN